MQGSAFHIAAIAALFLLPPAQADEPICVDCLKVRVGSPTVIRGPFPDELDATFNALKLPDGSFRGFSANGATYAIDGATLSDMGGPRRAVIQPGPKGSINDCGNWLTATVRDGDTLLGFVHQEHDCDYNAGRTGKSMAIARSIDNGLSWTDPETVITGREPPGTGGLTGEGDCSMLDGGDGYLYAYCLRNSDWKTIAARAPVASPTDWHKYYLGAWSEPGLGGNATAIGFFGPAAGTLRQPGWVATITTDPWFGGVRLSVSADRTSFLDLKEPLLTIDGSDWNRPADTDLVAYASLLDPDTGGSAVDWDFILGYIYVPPGKGFESRYLVYQPVSLTLQDAPLPVQAGMALTRWLHPHEKTYITSTGPLTGERSAYRSDTILAYMMTRAPDGAASVQLAECSSLRAGRLDQTLDQASYCTAGGYAFERTAGWLYTEAQPDTVPVYRCLDEATKTHFASNAPDCEGLGRMEFLLGYGLAP